MEGNLASAPKFDYATDPDCMKSICRLSTILVATIQEVKDRVSQIEFIFCGQLFPVFQSTSKSLQKRRANTRNVMEDEWKKKECALLHQIKDLLTEKRHCQEEIQQLGSSLEESKTRLMNAELLVKKHELENVQLMDKLERLTRNEDIIGELKMQIEQKTSELAEGKRLLEQGELNDQKLLIEQAKRRDFLEDYNRLKTSYKQLKSQYLYLVRKLGDNSGNEHQFDRMQEVKCSPRSYPKKRSLQDCEETEEEITNIASQTDAMKTGCDSQQKSEVHQDLHLAKRSNSDSHNIHLSCSQSILPKHIAGTAKSESLAGVKKVSSSWRDTRAQETRGRDPHDDFLDTPLEIARNLNKFPCEDTQDIAAPPPRDMDFNNSEDETQLVNTKTIPLQQHISILGPPNKAFKHVEPVRKKADRENLKGVECQQCKKFYDAVLPGGDNNPNRCEHHDGVSRHRYRYAPPMTPEGFWNIGFDSDM